MRSIAILALLGASAAGAQSLAQRVASSDGIVQVVYPSRPNACGDGRNYIGHVFGSSTYYSGEGNFNGHGSWDTRPCVHGPARAVVTVMSGEVTRMRSYVGPVPASDDVRTITASAAEASTWLSSIVSRGVPRAAVDAMMPLVLADVADPWPFLLGVARDENRPRDVRGSALHWLSMGVTDRLGLSNERADTDDDEMRKQAVFVLSQRPKSESVPELIDLARSAKYPSVRRSAIFWLGQTGDRRAAELYAELLKMR